VSAQQDNGDEKYSSSFFLNSESNEAVSSVRGTESENTQLDKNSNMRAKGRRLLPLVSTNRCASKAHEDKAKKSELSGETAKLKHHQCAYRSIRRGPFNFGGVTQSGEDSSRDTLIVMTNLRYNFSDLDWSACD
jgi:hypothetical protein